MSKMREAFEKWSNDALNIPDNEEVFAHRESFEAGYQAAIAAVKEGGAILEIGSVQGQTAYAFSLNGVVPIAGTRLYKLPEDLT